MYRRVITATVMAVGSLAFSITGASASSPGSLSCVGLACSQEQSSTSLMAPTFQAIPAIMPTVAAPQDLERQPQSGYYEFPVTTGQATPAIAYVVKSGDFANAPAAIRALPAANGIAAEDYSRATVVFFGRDVALTVPNGLIGKRVIAQAARHRSTAHRIKAKAANIDSFNCGTTASSLWFCIYEDINFGGRRLQFQETGFWQHLTDYAFNDNAASMRNRRDYTSILSENYDGGGDWYCALPHTADSTFENNIVTLYGDFRDDASAVWNSSISTGYPSGCDN